MTKKHIVALSMVVLFSPFHHSSMAATLEEVVVTAQKREESLQDLPIAIAAFGEQQLEDSGFNSLSDLAFLAPSTQLSVYGPIAYANMRGIGNENTTAGGDPGVALHFDGIYIGRPMGTLFTAFDTARVELLRGPQGTLYGRNATGGSINYITKKPTDELSGKVDVSFGDYNLKRLRGVINLPLNDTVRARLVAFKEERDGFTKNSVPGGTEANDADNWGLRAHLAIDIGDNASLLLSANHIESGGVGSQAELREAFPGSTTGQNLAGPPVGAPDTVNYVVDGSVLINDLSPFSEAKDTHESQSNELDMFAATLEVDLGGFTLKSVTAYLETSFNSVLDLDSSSKALAELQLVESSEQFTQEIQLSSNGDGPLNWIAGLFYFKEDAERRSIITNSRFDIIAGALGVASSFDVGGTVESKSIAVFGEATYAFSDTFRTTLGLRYTEDEKDGVNSGNQFGPTYSGAVGGNWDELTYKITSSWDMSDSSMVFASFSTGYKSGGINQVTNPNGGQPIYDPETVNAIEVGLKSWLMDDSVQLNASYFYNKYDDLQFQVFGPVGPESFNAKGATVHGLEVEVQVALTDSLRIDGSLGLIDSEFNAQIIQGESLGGNQVQRTPDVTFNIGLTNEWELASGNLRLRLEYAYKDEIYYTASNRSAGFADPGGSDLADSYFNANARLFWISADDQWTVEFSLTNLTDEVQEGNVFRDIGFVDIGGGGGPERITYNAPRQWGVRLGYKF